MPAPHQYQTRFNKFVDTRSLHVCSLFAVTMVQSSSRRPQKDDRLSQPQHPLVLIQRLSALDLRTRGSQGTTRTTNPTPGFKCKMCVVSRRLRVSEGITNLHHPQYSTVFLFPRLSRTVRCFLIVSRGYVFASCTEPRFFLFF